MYRSFLLAAVIAATFLAACAPMDSKTTAAADDPDAKTHVTGSRIPARDNSASVQSSSDRNAVGGVSPTPVANVPSVGGR